MKKKFLQIVSTVLAVVMLLPTAAFADDTGSTPSTTTSSESGTTAPTSLTIEAEEGTTTIYNKGDKTTLHLKVKEGVSVTWSVIDGDSVTVSSSGVVTAVKPGKSTVRATYNTKDGFAKGDCEVTVSERTLSEISVSGTPKTTYTTGDDFSMGSATVIAKYEDGSTEDVTSSCTYTPSSDLRASDTSVNISYTENEITKTTTVDKITVTDKTVSGISIVSPANGAKFTAGTTIAKKDVSIKVTYSNGDKVTLSAEDYSDISFSPNGELKTTDNTFTVSYGGQSATIAIAVSASSSSTAGSGSYYAIVSKSPTKTSYKVGENLDLSGIEVLVYNRADSTLYKTLYSSNFSRISYTFTSSDVDKTQKTMTVTIDGCSVEIIITGLTITAASNVTGLNSSSYELDDDAELKIGDKLNDDVKWYDIFDYVYVTDSSGKTKVKSKSALEEDFPGVELLLKVYGKTTNSTVIEAKDLETDGTVRLQLYVKNGTTSITDTSKSIRVYVSVEEAECTVSIYSNKTSTSSTYLKASKTFESLKSALNAIADEDELEDEFDISFGSNYVIRIQLGKDQSYTGTFAPDYENPIVIDLNGHELKLKSEWINYKKCDDLVVTVTNTNDDDYGTLTYSDLSTSLVVADGSKLEFSEDVIPMDSDADCMVTIYRSSSSSTVLGTKVYDDLKEALSELEDEDDVIDDFDIPSSYEDTFVISIKLGKDQSLSSYKFAPDYDTTVTIDLNGCTLKLKSEWIDYDDCDKLVVNVTNTNKDKKGTLTYTDLSTSITLAKGDSALKFAEDTIPGLYNVNIGSVTNGKVTTSKATVARGDTVTITITPDKGYEISSVKVGGKTITASTSGYTVSSSTGVGTYKLENVTADVSVSVTFKKSSTASSSTSTSTSTSDWVNPFSDISTNSQYYNAVAFVCNNGLFNGMTATKFEPMTTMTRAMFVTVLGRLAGIDTTKYAGSSFTDVSTSDQQISWAAPYIEWAVQIGITNGMGDGKFAPNDPITHQQMYLFMKRYAEKVANVSTSVSSVSLSSISDASSIDSWATDGVKFASKYGILITSGGKLTPKDNALRCELAMLLHGFCTKVLGYND